MQETYIKILSAAHLYKPMGKPLAWMFTISKNLYLTKLNISSLSLINIKQDESSKYLLNTISFSLVIVLSLFTKSFSFTLIE